MSFSEKIVDDFFGRRYLTLSNYYKHLVKTLSIISQRGNAIIVGRGANFLLPDSLNIRIICNMNQRIKWTMKYEKMTEKEAIKRIEKSDENRKEFNKILYHHDINKPVYYDLIIQTSEHLTINDAVDIIEAHARKKFKLK